MRSPPARLALPLSLASLLLSGTARASEPDPWFGRDKAYHFAASAVAAGVGYGGASLVWSDRTPRAVVASGFALSLGVGKELYDLSGRGDPSWRDLAWDVAGTAVGLGLSLLVDWAVRGSRPGQETTGQTRAALVQW